jgi:hypothetical protein
VQECKEPNVEMYKLIWGLMFKCIMAAEYNLIWFNSHKNIAIKEMWEKKDQTRTQDVTEFGFKNAYVSGTLNLQQLRLSRNTKNSFTLVELGHLHKNRLPSLSVIKVTTHSKRWVTTHSKRWALQLNKGWALQLKKIFTRRSRRIKLGE